MITGYMNGEAVISRYNMSLMDEDDFENEPSCGPEKTSDSDSGLADILSAGLFYYCVSDHTD